MRTYFCLQKKIWKIVPFSPEAENGSITVWLSAHVLRRVSENTPKASQYTKAAGLRIPHARGRWARRQRCDQALFHSSVCRHCHRPQDTHRRDLLPVIHIIHTEPLQEAPGTMPAPATPFPRLRPGPCLPQSPQCPALAHLNPLCPASIPYPVSRGTAGAPHPLSLIPGHTRGPPPLIPDPLSQIPDPGAQPGPLTAGRGTRRTERRRRDVTAAGGAGFGGKRKLFLRAGFHLDFLFFPFRFPGPVAPPGSAAGPGVGSEGPGRAFAPGAPGAQSVPAGNKGKVPLFSQANRNKDERT